MAFPKPSNLAGVKNGELNTALLSVVTDGTRRDHAHPLAARSFIALVAAAALAGYRIGFTDAYRPLSDQIRLFLSRYLRVGWWTRNRWDGSHWQKKDPRLATAATPGRSNHGLGLSFDLCLIVNGRVVALAANPFALAWMRANAGRFGLVEDVRDEPWHWTYHAGDRLPAAVLSYEASLRPSPPPPPPPPVAPAPALNPIIEFKEDDVRVITVMVPCNESGKGWAPVPDATIEQILGATVKVGHDFRETLPEVRAFAHADGYAAVHVSHWFPNVKIAVEVVLR